MRTSVLTDLEFRVWIQYQNSADDFGVMRFSVLTIQNDNAALAKRSAEVIQKALEALVTIRLVDTFEHQGVTYLYQLDWQNFQKKQYVRATNLPKPPSLAHCTTETQHLFSCHKGPGRVPPYKQPLESIQINSKQHPESLQNNSCESLASRETLTHTLTLTPTLTLTQSSQNPDTFLLGQNGHRERLEPDEAWQRFQADYPGEGREGGYMAQQRFLAACESVGLQQVMDGLERFKKSKKVKNGFVIGMEKWLAKTLWIQEPEANEPSADASLELTRKHLEKLDDERRQRHGQ